jgi:hypothetical protein
VTPTATATPHDYRPLAVACYDFESGGIGDDSCGSNTFANNGVTANASDAQWNAASGAFDSSSGQYLSCTTAACPTLNLGGATQQITIMCWAKRTAVTDSVTASIFAHEEDASGSWAFFKNSSDEFEAGLRPDGDCTDAFTTVSSGVTLAPGDWHHLVMTSDNLDLKVYVDAAAPVSTAYSSGVCAATSDFSIGAKAATPVKDFWDGQLDECAVFPSALTAEQICDVCRFGIDGEHADRAAACNNCTGT